MNDLLFLQLDEVFPDSLTKGNSVRKDAFTDLKKFVFNRFMSTVKNNRCWSS